jgi:hypothetical protein
MDTAENLKTHIDSMVKRQSVILCEDQSQGILNDDYCDCHDGRDEPNTAACSHILMHKASFRCKDGSSLLFPSRVGDGIKDDHKAALFELTIPLSSNAALCFYKLQNYHECLTFAILIKLQTLKYNFSILIFAYFLKSLL